MGQTLFKVMKIKKTVFVLLFVLPFVGCKSLDSNFADQSFKNLDSLAVAMDFFTLRERYSAKKDEFFEKESLYLDAILKNAFNKPELSNKAIQEFLEFPITETSDSLRKRLLGTKLTNYIHLYQYAEALQVNEELQRNYAQFLDSTRLEDLRNTQKIWKALENIPPQQIFIPADVSLPITKDKAGLATLATEIGGTTTQFVFDTGANFSVIQRSVADSLGMNLIPAQFDVDAATGLKVKSDLAVAEELQLGEITLKHVVFLVFDDADLSFPSINYEIKGILGFPVIRAMQEIHITEDSLYIPQQPTDYHLYNLAYDEFMPIVKVMYGQDPLRFNFDTGAQTTSLYSKFYRKYQPEIDANYTKTTLNTGGAGGHASFQGYRLNNVSLSIGDAEATLDTELPHAGQAIPRLKTALLNQDAQVIR